MLPYNIELIKISKLGLIFKPNEVCIDPARYGFDTCCLQHTEEAAEKAKAIDGICIAVVRDAHGGRQAIAKACNSDQMKFVLFNAKCCNRRDSGICAVTFNEQRDWPWQRKYRFKRYYQFCPGSIG